MRVLSSFYAQWRLRCGLVPALREDLESPPEHLLQAVWQHQRLLREQLKLLDARPVRVLHPGFRSSEGGPDFRGAVIQFADEAPRSGDVEVDLRASGWRAHGHDRNPAFRNVILHVIWENESRKGGTDAPPVLPLQGALDARLGELSLWLGSEAAEGLPEVLRGQCVAPLRGLTSAQLGDLLHQAAHVRLQSKAAQFQARARQAGWEQSLWEGLFRALGYKHNIWPMQRLAELRSRWFAPRTEAFALQARLLGLSGLLPVELPGGRGDGYVRRVWDQWWRERDAFADCILPRSLWRFHGLRPANHPQRRLALAAHWSAESSLATKLEHWCAAEGSAPQMAASLLETLQVGSDEFWSWHCTFRSARLKRAQPLLGGARVTDLAINVVLPWLWARAVEGKTETMQRGIERRYFSWPAAEDNAVLRLARQRLLGGASRRVLAGAAAQQGLLQIVHDFCNQTNALCENCKLPQLARDFVRNP